MKKLWVAVCIMTALALGAWAGEDREGGERKGHGDMGGDRDARAEQMKQEMLKRLDTDGDGQVSDAERKAQMEKMMLQRFTAMDTDGNGSISKEEWLASAQKQNEMRGNRERGGEMEKNRKGEHGQNREHGNNGVGNGADAAPAGNPPANDGAGTGPGNPGNQGGAE